MDRYTLLADKLKNRERIVMANVLNVKNPFLLSAFSSADCILIDKEHGIYGSEEIMPLTAQCRTMGIPSIVRAEDAVYHLIAKAIYMGADGIMLPRTESLEQVRTAVEAMNFPPDGRLGFGGWGLLREGEDIPGYRRFLFVQIESRKGRELIPEMMERYGRFIDAFIIGPNDYSISTGVPRELDHPKMHEEYKAFYKTCTGLGVSCGTFDPDIPSVTRDMDMGANVFWIGDDIACMKSGFDSLIAGMPEMKR